VRIKEAKQIEDGMRKGYIKESQLGIVNRLIKKNLIGNGSQNIFSCKEP